MIQYREILELYEKGVSQRTISASIRSSRQTVSKVINRAREREMTVLTDEMTNAWLKLQLFPSQTPKGRGFIKEDWRYVHAELKKHMTLRLLHKEYEMRAADHTPDSHSDIQSPVLF
ncbi:hypothetical protein [Salinicoccus roseus]|uniref:hypothetical protein n=1 Tax=Salinicoccus roseus TaxID=45670 RepID=UPI000FC2D1C7|nr:hypothetical protein [Salinicoccus roseus]RPE52869.1 hypothetical protein EDC33_1640 [Salinicoccus roseus]GGA72756.1 hypothetical protein GCM10007176_16160 [Salinicoccus roseus]